MSKFVYTYSAKEQEEIKKIREKYMTPEDNKLEMIRRMDAAVERKATMYAIVLGVFGTLVLGIGMSFALVWAKNLFIPGIVIGLVGIAILACAYPLYVNVLKKEREKIAPEILKLTEELMK